MLEFFINKKKYPVHLDLSKIIQFIQRTFK